MNQEKTITRRVRVVLNCQQALLKSITPNIRKVVVNWDEHNIMIHFVYDGQYSKEDMEEAERVAAKMRASFPEDDVKINYLRLDFPTPLYTLGLGEQAIYVRKEVYPDEGQFQTA
jgi:hypothetical protein